MSARIARQGVAAAGAARGFHEFVAAQLAEQLLEVGERDALALADGSQSDRAIALAQGQINHRGDRKPALGGKTHRKLLVAQGKKRRPTPKGGPTTLCPSVGWALQPAGLKTYCFVGV